MGPSAFKPRSKGSTFSARATLLLLVAHSTSSWVESLSPSSTVGQKTACSWICLFQAMLSRIPTPRVCLSLCISSEEHSVRHPVKH